MFTPKYRKRAIYGQLKRAIGSILRQLCEQQGIELLAGHAMADHVHLLVSVPERTAKVQHREHGRVHQREVGDPNPR
jgi:REP element-mobilizing transposase RayT